MLILLKTLQGIFLILGIVIVVMFLRDYRINKEQGVTRNQTIANYTIGFVTNFFDALGIGSFATTMAAFKLTKMVPDKLIPGTLNVGDSLPVVVEALLFITVIKVEAVTLVAMLVSCIAGAIVGVRFAETLPLRGIRTTMAVGLFLAALLMFCSKVGWIPGGGDAVGLEGTQMMLAMAGNFILGAILPLGIGNYAPCMVIVYMLGLSPAVAFPIMMGSAALALSTSTIRFIASGAFFHRKVAAGLLFGGVPGVCVAVYIVRSLPLDILQWLVIAVVLYTSITMFRQVFAVRKKTEREILDQ